MGACKKETPEEILQREKGQSYIMGVVTGLVIAIAINIIINLVHGL